MSIFDEYMAGVDAEARAAMDSAEQRTEELKELVGEAEDENKLVSVQVDSSGELTSLSIQAKAMRLASEDLAELVRTTTNDAIRQLQEQVQNSGPVSDFKEMAEKIAGEHGSLANAVGNLQREMQGRLQQAEADLERMRPNPAWLQRRQAMRESQNNGQDSTSA